MKMKSTLLLKVVIVLFLATTVLVQRCPAVTTEEQLLNWPVPMYEGGELEKVPGAGGRYPFPVGRIAQGEADLRFARDEVLDVEKLHVAGAVFQHKCGGAHQGRVTGTVSGCFALGIVCEIGRQAGIDETTFDDGLVNEVRNTFKYA